MKDFMVKKILNYYWIERQQINHLQKKLKEKKYL